MAENKAEEHAEKALIAARAAVDEAKRLVKKLDEKTRKEAEELADQLQQAERDHAEAVQRARATAEQRRAAASASAASTGIPTFRDLRDRAKAQGIQGYSRMNKAQLLHALGEG